MVRLQLSRACIVIVAALSLIVANAAARAGPVLSGHEDHKLFGNLDQADTNCPNNGCGPTAAVNSFVFLQNMYPDIYGDSLVPITRGQGGIPSEENMAAVANTLLGSNYMNTDCSCGTTTQNFYDGKMKYVNEKAPNTTVYDFESLTNDRAITAPTANFIAGELRDGEGVEALISGNMFGHYITLTDFTFDTRDDTGSLSYINPDGGTWETKDIIGLASNGTLTFNYSNDCTICEITDVFSESPIMVPEPTGLSLLITPFLILLWITTNRYASRRTVVCRPDSRDS